jgi:putative transposase
MKKSTNMRHGRHCVFDLHLHLVFVTKYRRKVFTKRVLKELWPIFSSVCHDFEAELIECDGAADYVHLSIHYPPKVAPAKLVNSLKGVSSRLLRKKAYPEIKKALWRESLWSPSYFAGSCGGAPLKLIKEYISNQGKPQKSGLSSPP